MNEIIKKPITAIGYGFVPDSFLPEGGNEYYLRNIQNRSGIQYRNLSAYEIEVLVRNSNTSDNWNNIHVSDAFNPELVKNCKFFGLVRIGKLEPLAVRYHNVTMPVGLYNSTIISCDFGDNVVVNHVNYMSHYIIGSEVMLLNINELHVTDHSKFGNGIIKQGEDESVRIWVEICNENAGRKILPFNGMLPGDAWLWSKHRDDRELMQRFKEFTEKKFDNLRGYYGKIGDCTVIKNTAIIKDVWVGSHAYIKGANKLKNLTINSEEGATSQIGEGCELVNGIISKGCRIFYGVKAVRFVMASHSQLKYGARLINSFLGNNSTISCCEVLNSLIFPAHEQHHNNSFLCAAVVMGQSNIAAGATIGSNHNSRAADGEMLAARGFWPGLCVSLKHNSRFATFTLIAKGDYPAELNIPLPFSLVSNDTASDRLMIMPAYWFLYNLYALARNSGKYVDRDKRMERVQHIDYDYLAPDSVNEIFEGLHLLRVFTARAAHPEYAVNTDHEILRSSGEILLSDPATDIVAYEVLATGFENSRRPVVIGKVKEAYSVYKNLVLFYGTMQVLRYQEKHGFASFEALLQALPAEPQRLAWQNIGGQLMPRNAVDTMLRQVREGSMNSWDDIHQFYEQNGALYEEQKLHHAWASLLEILNCTPAGFTRDIFHNCLRQAAEIKEWMVEQIYQSRAKDYQSSFRKMMYDNDTEMEEVIGKLDDNAFIAQQRDELQQLQATIRDLSSRWKS